MTRTATGWETTATKKDLGYRGISEAEAAEVYTIKLVYNSDASDDTRDWYDLYINDKLVGSAPCDPGYDLTHCTAYDLLFFDFAGNENGDIDALLAQAR